LLFFAKKVSVSRADFDGEGTNGGMLATPYRPAGPEKNDSSRLRSGETWFG